MENAVRVLDQESNANSSQPPRITTSPSDVKLFEWEKVYNTRGGGTFAR